MIRDSILFRVDATPRTGYENLARCLTFAAALQRRRRTAHFLSRVEPGSLGLAIKRAGNGWLDADTTCGGEGDLAETLQEIRRLKPAAVLVDSPDVSEEYLKAIRETGVMLFAFDHQANIRFPAQVLINPLLGPDKEVYEFYPDTQLLMGPRYTLVRSEVRKCRSPRSQEPALLPPISGKTAQGQFRALISLGEDDPHEQSLKLAKLMLNVPRIGRVDVIVRPHHPHLEALQAFAEANPERLEIAVEPAEVQARLLRCHFAIASGSGWSLELASIGVPQLLIVQSETYWPTAQRLEEEGCATCLGWYENVSAQTIRTAVLYLLADANERQALSR
jgi:UDP-2,4-diacetamido-2,4,6-trideoxy-beta-L-altropyranose hydrolase